MPKKLLLGLLLALAGVTGLLVTGHFLDAREQRMFGRSEWPITQGTVLSSHLGVTSGDNVDLTVEFAYLIDGVRYVQKQQWSVGEELFSETPPEAQAAKLRYSPGRIVPVYYNPLNPLESAVETRVYDTTGWEVYVYGGGFTLSILMVLAGIVLVAIVIFGYLGNAIFDYYFHRKWK